MRALDFNTRTQVTRLVWGGADWGSPGGLGRRDAGRWLVAYLLVKGVEIKLGEAVRV